MSDERILIAGAGPCGIGAAWTLHHEAPHQPFLLIDENNGAGGLAASETTPDGFTFDYGGHVLFPHKKYELVGTLLDDLVKEWNHSCPLRGVYMRGRMIPTPIQRNVHRLPVRESLPIFANLLYHRVFPNKAAPRAREESLTNYLHRSFGRELTRRVMEPLNRKMWCLDPSLLSSVWVQHRSGSHMNNIPSIQLRRLFTHALLGKDDPQWNAATRVRYPAHGGTGSIWSKAADRLGAGNLLFGKRICAIKTFKKRVVLCDGAEFSYSHLISTIPLDTLLGLCVDRPQLGTLAVGLRKSTALLFGFGIEGPIPARYKGIHSFHCPEPRLPFWRVTIPSNLSPGNVPDAGRCYSVLCEVSCEPHDRVEIDARWRTAVTEGLLRIGLLSDRRQVSSVFERKLPHGYPLPFLGRDELLADIQDRLESIGILSRGRFGGWRYEVSNQDYAFMQGVEAVRYLMTGTPEETYVNRQTADPSASPNSLLRAV